MFNTKVTNTVLLQAEDAAGASGSEDRCRTHESVCAAPARNRSKPEGDWRYVKR